METDKIVYNEDNVEIIDKENETDTTKNRKTYTPMEAAKIIGVSKTTIHTYINEFKEYLEDHLEKNELGHNFLDDEALNMIKEIAYMRRQLHLTNEEVKEHIGTDDYLILAESSEDDRLKKYIALRDAKLDNQFKKLSDELSQELRAQTNAIAENISMKMDAEAKQMIEALKEKNAQLEKENSNLQSQISQYELEKVKFEYETKIKIMEEKLENNEKKKKGFSLFRRN